MTNLTRGVIKWAGILIFINSNALLFFRPSATYGPGGAPRIAPVIFDILGAVGVLVGLCLLVWAWRTRRD